MALFSYHARDTDGKEVSGTVESLNADSAVRSLEDLHLTSITVAEATRIRIEEPTPPAPLTLKMAYVFEGKDPKGATRKGTIQAATKRAAFDRLKSEQKLVLSLLVPMNQTPPPRDRELELWQSVPAPGELPATETKAVTSVPKLERPVGFTLPDAPKNSSAAPESLVSPVTARDTSRGIGDTSPGIEEPQAYYPLISTLRLYAGWLLAWYAVFVMLGYYSLNREVPLQIPFVAAFSSSPLIFTFTVATFLFLLLSSLHRAMHGRLVSGIMFTVIGVVMFMGVRLSI